MESRDIGEKQISSENILVFGAGGAAQEILQLIEQIYGQDKNIHGIILAQKHSEQITLAGKKIRVYAETEISKLSQDNNLGFIISFGNPDLRKKIYELYASLNYINLVHPSVDMHPTVTMGRGNIIKKGTQLTTNIKLGHNNYLNRGVQIGHDVEIGNHNAIHPCAVLSGGVMVKEASLIGANATILEGSTIASQVKIGASALLKGKTEKEKTYVGVPAKEV